jgi:general secretion pathway protein D
MIRLLPNGTQTALLFFSGLLLALLSVNPISGQTVVPNITVPPATEPASGAEVVQTAEGQAVNLNFDQAPLKFAAQLVSRHTGKRFIINEDPDQTFTLISSKPVPQEELLPFFLQSLEAQGMVGVETGDIVYIVSLEDALGMGGDLRDGTAGPIDRFGTYGFQLEHVSAADLAKAIEPLVPQAKEKGALQAIGPSNLLLVTGTASTVRRIAHILKTVDRPGAGRELKIVYLKHAGAEELASQLQAAFEEQTSAESRFQQQISNTSIGMGSLPTSVRIIPQPRINALLLVGPERDVNQVQDYVNLLDVEAPMGRERLTALHLKYLDPTKIAEQLTNVYAQRAGQDPDRAGMVSIQANPSNNAIILSAPPEDMQLITSLVEDLDVQQEQVMIEVVVAEITTSNSSDIGMEWASIEMPQDGSLTVLGRTNLDPSGNLLGDVATGAVVPDGFGFAVAKGTFIDQQGNVQARIPFLLNALRDNSDFRILSNPTLWTQDNSEASFNVVEEIPVLKSVIEGGAGTARDVIQNIERIEVGIKLKVTPRVSLNGDVTLKINPEVEAILEESSGEMPLTPKIARRAIDTVVTIQDGDTLAISGLIRDNSIKRVRKVPFLGDIPVLGKAFRREIESFQRTNLLVFLTPRIIRTPEDADQQTLQMEENFGIQKTGVEKTLEKTPKQQNVIEWLGSGDPKGLKDVE